MKHIAAIALFVVASVLTAGSAIAQDHAVKATVPFNFNVNGHSLPAGNYTLGTEITSPLILNITDREKGVHAMAMTQPSAGGDKQTNVMVFHRYGNQYFLTEIRADASSLNVRIPTSKEEKRARAQVEQAGLRTTSDDVIVALY
jgi:hypothetical protein